MPENAPVFKAFDTQKYNEQISKFQELNKLKDPYQDILHNLKMF